MERRFRRFAQRVQPHCAVRGGSHGMLFVIIIIFILIAG
jgi:hypothetical protein